MISSVVQSELIYVFYSYIYICIFVIPTDCCPHRDIMQYIIAVFTVYSTLEHVESLMCG